MTLSPGRGQRAEINVTPLIDVLLVLLIIFMVITPLHSRGLDALVPQPSHADHEPDTSTEIVVTVCEDGMVRINQQPAPVPVERLLGLFSNNINHPLFLRAEPGLEFRQVARVIDLARGAGLTRVALMPRSR